MKKTMGILVVLATLSFLTGCSGVDNIQDVGSLNRPVTEPSHSGVGGI